MSVSPRGFYAGTFMHLPALLWPSCLPASSSAGMSDALPRADEKNDSICIFDDSNCKCPFFFFIVSCIQWKSKRNESRIIRKSFAEEPELYRNYSKIPSKYRRIPTVKAIIQKESKVIFIRYFRGGKST